MARSLIASSGALTVTSVPLGGYADVFTSGDAYKSVDSVIQRSQYPDMSLAFPRKSAYSTISRTLPGSAQAWLGIGYGNGMFIAVSSTATYATSTDGINWASRIFPLSIEWRGVAYGAGVYVVVGTASGGGVTTTCLSSPDGVNWTQRATPSLACSGVVYSSALGLFVAYNGTGSGVVTSGQVMTSPDGITWTARGLTAAGNWVVTTGGADGRFVAVAVGSTTGATSLDGITWTARPLPLSSNWFSITYGNGLFVAVGSSQVSITSPDGIAWTYRNIPIPAAITAVVYGDGVFVAMAASYTYVATSPDGMNWTQRPFSAGAFGAYGAGCFMFVQSGSTAASIAVYTENNTNSDYMYISGTTGKYVRVK